MVAPPRESIRSVLVHTLEREGASTNGKTNPKISQNPRHMGTNQWGKGQGACGISAGCEALKFSRMPTTWAFKIEESGK